MVKAGKWGKKFWQDTAERVGSTLTGALIAAVTVTGTTPVNWSDAAAVWGIIGVPTLVSALKCLYVNFQSSDPEPSASLVGVSSSKKVRREVRSRVV